MRGAQLIAFALLAATMSALAFPTAAAGDPCTAPLPSHPGEAFSGVVRYVGDGDSLCVGASRDHATWIEVRLSDFDAPELHSPQGSRSRQYLRDIALGREIRCVAVRGRTGRVLVWDRVIARCTIQGRAIGEVLRAAGAPEGGN